LTPAANPYLHLTSQIRTSARVICEHAKWEKLLRCWPAKGLRRRPFPRPHPCWRINEMGDEEKQCRKLSEVSLSHTMGSILTNAAKCRNEFCLRRGGHPRDCRRFCTRQSLKEPQSPTALNERFATGSISINWEQQNSTAFNWVLNLVRDQVLYPAVLGELL